MVHITFMVGNGFDISVGIDTSYDGFYTWYCNQKKDKMSEHIQKFKKQLKEDMCRPPTERTWADFELGLGEYTKSFNSDTFDQFQDCYEDAMLRLHEYIELQLKNIPTEYDSEKVSKFGQSLLKLQDELAGAERRDILEMLPEHANQDIKYHFISFNYTSILDKMVESQSQLPIKIWKKNNYQYSAKIDSKVVHVHGMLNNNPLMGVDNEEEIANSEFRKDENFVSYFIKPKACVALGETSHDEAKKMIEDSNIICLWGLSLGQTDSQWWEKIMDWLGKNKSHILIIFWYTGGRVTKRLVSRYLKEIDMVKNKLLEYSHFQNEQIGEVKKRIFVVIDAENVLRVSLQQESNSLVTAL